MTASEPGPERGSQADPERLARWAIIDLDPPSRGGGRIARVGRGIALRLLRQWHEDVAAQQVRVNVAVREELDELRRRVAELEAGRDRSG